MIRPLACAALVLLASACATHNPKVLDSFTKKNGLEVQGSFDVSRSIRGYTIQNLRGGRGVIYVVDGKYGFVGNMVDPEGVNLTKQHLEDHVYDLAGAYAKLETVAEPITADPSTPIFGFFEPQCGYCAQAYKDFKAAGIEVKWVPVHFFSDDSLKVLAAVYAADAEHQEPMLFDASQAFKAHQLSDWLGGATYGTSNMRRARDLATRHEAIMKQAGISGTPSFLVKINGKVMQMTAAEVLDLRQQYLRKQRPPEQALVEPSSLIPSTPAEPAEATVTENPADAETVSATPEAVPPAADSSVEGSATESPTEAR